MIEVAARTANVDLRETLEALRAASSPSAGRSGLADVPTLAAQLRRAGLTVSVLCLGAIPAPPPALDAAAYRIVQESLANALAHAGAVRASVELVEFEGVLRITVSNQAGTPAAAHLGSGFGFGGHARACGAAWRPPRSLAAARREVSWSKATMPVSRS